jgi:hypothetical protein
MASVSTFGRSNGITTPVSTEIFCISSSIFG